MVLDFTERYVTTFYENLAKGKLVGQKCKRCGSYQFFPIPVCRTCKGTDLEWTEFSGKGKLLLVQAAKGPASGGPRFDSILPCAFGVVQLAEGPVIFCPVIEGIDLNNIPEENRQLPLYVEITTREVAGNFIPVARALR
ncbi:MAG: zinc ribbon domain-containing protein [Candidatus Bathyarchaeia archaeon]